MIWLVQPRLVNGPFDDPGLYLDFRFGRRALMFDLGDLGGLSSREIVRLTHVCVSHMHVDHFIGFDALLRLNLYQSKTLSVIGPPGLTAAARARLSAYQWNLLDERSANFIVATTDWSPEGFQERAIFFRDANSVPNLTTPTKAMAI